ncbi:lipocalin-like domain-containing protein [Paracoccus jeotgali]|uniref:Iron ABC transporter permease n=1 Tax=Paracoccus jeotgali TaxID=2065379 RepID=A0A2K9MGI5_9RHOB|nr:lipocalin-like domain-containing protein [Paracoccus jeotgali]AUM74720.1 iron ABC transporter permease [Paracoccus jeotgali]
MNASWLLALCLAALPAAAQERGFAGLGAESSGFAIPDPARAPIFPRDHGPHEDFRIEWWYLTANLQGSDGRDYGVQWTLFRSALSPQGASEGWASPQVWMAHAALTTPDAHHVAERFARGGIGQAGVTAQPFRAWIDEWSMQAMPDSDGIGDLTLTARGPDFAYDLTATADGPLVLHGQNGYSVKGPGGQASRYYSQPFYRVTGHLALPQGAVEVTGQAWLDREWSSQPLDRSQSGWDWFALHLDDGRKLMAARVRGETPFVFGSLIEPTGAVIPLDGETLLMTPDAGAPPVSWRIGVPDQGVDVTVTAINPRSYMTTSVPYWEGPVTVSGSVAGKGYLEMTGYPAE